MLDVGTFLAAERRGRSSCHSYAPALLRSHLVRLRFSGVSLLRRLKLTKIFGQRNSRSSVGFPPRELTIWCVAIRGDVPRQLAEGISYPLSISRLLDALAAPTHKNATFPGSTSRSSRRRGMVNRASRGLWDSTERRRGWFYEAQCTPRFSVWAPCACKWRGLPSIANPSLGSFMPLGSMVSSALSRPVRVMTKNSSIAGRTFHSTASTSLTFRHMTSTARSPRQR